MLGAHVIYLSRLADDETRVGRLREICVGLSRTPPNQSSRAQLLAFRRFQQHGRHHCRQPRYPLHYGTDGRVPAGQRLDRTQFGFQETDGMRWLLCILQLDYISQDNTLIDWTLWKQWGEVSVFEINIRFVGGLLSCFALTGDHMFREKALLIAERLLPAFDTPTGIPLGIVNMENGVRINVASAHTWLPPKYRLLYSGIWNDFPFCFISCFIFFFFFSR